MIEKPKRPKKISNQDNKQPQNIEQLIRRYDLDNTKIYDFLDELVGELKQFQEESINMMKIFHINKEITIPANSYSSGITFGNITIPDDYSFVGIISCDYLNDRILSTYSPSIRYGGTGNMNIYASFYNTYSGSITKTMGCSIIAIKNRSL